MAVIVETMELPFIAKVLPPKRRDYYVRRERLLAQLAEGLSKKAQIIWAPAGYGKTSLLVDVASDVDVPVCWYSFAPEDNDPSGFLRYCIQSIQSNFPNFSTSHRPLIKGGFDGDWSTQCGLLVNALESDISSRLVFAFDDLHYIAGKRELEGVVSLLIERSPDNVHFLLASRNWPSLSCLPKLAASDDLFWLNMENLRFSAEETEHLLANLWKRPVPSETADAINERTKGWAAAILLTARSPSATISPDTTELGDHGILFAYLSAEVFDKLPDSLQSFLLRTSILREFTAPLCDNLLGLTNSQTLIDEIKDRSLFIEERPGRTTTYAYHDLFREYLERRFKLQLLGEYQRLNRRAAVSYSELGDDDAAIYHFLQIGESAKVVEIVKQVSGSYFDQLLWSKLASWLDKLPANILESDPDLLLLNGRILTMRAGDPTGALEQFDKLLTGDHAKNQEVVGKALVAKSTAYRRLGHLNLAVKVARDGLALLIEVDCPKDHVAEGHRQLASALATKGELALGKQHFQAAMEIVSKDNLSLYSLISDGLAVACLELSELDEAAMYLEQARAGWLKLGSEGPLAESLINLALVYCHQGEFDLTFDEVAEALSRQATIQQALDAYEDSLASASRALKMARELLDQRLVGESTSNLGYAYFQMGETSKATVLLTQALLEAEHSDQKYIVANYHNVLGQLYCQEGSYDQASHHLNVAVEQLTEIQSFRRVAEAKLYQAAIYYRRGKPKEALERLNQVAHLISDIGYDGFLLAYGDEVLDVLRFGAAKRVGGETFIRLVARLTHRTLSVEESNIPVSANDSFSRFPVLRAFGFGAPSVVLDSHKVSDLEWRSRKSKELFFFLLCNKRPQSNEEILDALWPEASTDLSDSALKTSIYRLRQAVFYECVSAHDAGYQINPGVSIQFDIEDFQRHLTLATGEKQGKEDRQEHLQKAIELYDGPFLNGFYSEWCQRLRTDLELKYHTALMNLAEYHTAMSKFLESADLLGKVVESDPYHEEAQFRLIDSYIEANEPLVALQHLRKYIKVCREELGVQLPPRFTLCHDKILSHLARDPAPV